MPRNIQICIYIVKASKRETFLQSESKKIKQRCWIWLENTYNLHA